MYEGLNPKSGQIVALGVFILPLLIICGVLAPNGNKK
jgi:hypothetical protein